jgi:hypothetical protein
MKRCIDVKTLSAATLRQLLSEAETREGNSVDHALVESDPAQGLPVHLRSIARALPPILSMRECGSVLKVAPITLKRWIKQGKLTKVQSEPHGKVFITRDAVLQLLGSENAR